MPLLYPLQPHVVIHDLNDASSTWPFLVQKILTQLSSERDPCAHGSESKPNGHCALHDALSGNIERIATAVTRLRRLNSLRFLPPLLALFVECCVGCSPNVIVHDSIWVSMCKLPVELSSYCAFRRKYTFARMLVTRSLPHVSVDPIRDDAYGAPLSSRDDSSSPSRGPSPDPIIVASTSTSGPSEMDMRAFASLPVPQPSTITYRSMPSTRVPVDISVNRHLFAGDISMHSIALVGLAPRDDIYDVLSSILYQRLAWNVRTPALGLTYSENGWALQVIIAWLDDEPCVENELPRVHVSHTPFTANEAAPDIFSLADSVAATCLARIILSLVHTDISYSFVADADLTVWRADQQIPPAGPSFKRPISRWLEELPVSPDDYDTLVCDSEALKNDENFSHLDLLQSEFASSPGRISFDRFVTLEEKRNLMPSACSMWLLDRHVVPEGLPPFCKYHEVVTPSSPKPENPIFNDTLNQTYVPLYNTYLCATRLDWIASNALSRHSVHLQQFVGDLCRAVDAQPAFYADTACGERIVNALNAILPDVLHLCPVSALRNHEPGVLAASHCQALLILCGTWTSGHDHYSLITRSNVRYRLPRNDHLRGLRRTSRKGDFFPTRLAQRDHRLAQRARLELYEQCGDVRLVQQYEQGNQRYEFDTTMWILGASDANERVHSSPLYGECNEFLLIQVPDCCPSDSGDFSKLLSFCISEDTQPPFVGGWVDHSARTIEVREYTRDVLAHCPHPASAQQRDQSHEFPVLDTQSVKAEKNSHSAGNQVQQDVDGPMMTCPLLAVCYNRDATGIYGGFNRLSFALTAAAKFLAFLGVYDFPVFGLFFTGTTCVVTMAWTSQANKRGIEQTHIVENNLRSYDMCNPAEVLALSCFILWIRLEHALRLAQIITGEQCRSIIVSRLSSEDTEDGWSQEAQLQNFGYSDY